MFDNDHSPLYVLNNKLQSTCFNVNAIHLAFYAYQTDMIINNNSIIP